MGDESSSCTNVRISVSELAEIISQALSEFSEQWIETNDDFYWTILYDEKFDMLKKPSVLAVGSLEDDLKHLRLIHAENIPFGQSDISRLSALLKLLENNIE